MLLEELAGYIQQQTTLKPGQTLFIGTYPDKPDTLLALYDTGGSGRPPGLKDLQRTVQVIARGGDYKTGHDLAWKVFNLLDRDFIILPGGRKIACRANQPPSPLTRDQSGRTLFVFNLSIWTSPNP
jgi:hypothetical protein